MRLRVYDEMRKREGGESVTERRERQLLRYYIHKVRYIFIHKFTPTDVGVFFLKM